MGYFLLGILFIVIVVIRWVWPAGHVTWGCGRQVWGVGGRVCVVDLQEVDSYEGEGQEEALHRCEFVRASVVGILISTGQPLVPSYAEMVCGTETCGRTCASLSTQHTCIQGPPSTTEFFIMFPYTKFMVCLGHRLQCLIHSCTNLKLPHPTYGTRNVEICVSCVV